MSLYSTMMDHCSHQSLERKNCNRFYVPNFLLTVNSRQHLQTIKELERNKVRNYSLGREDFSNKWVPDISLTSKITYQRCAIETEKLARILWKRLEQLPLNLA